MSEAPQRPRIEIVVVAVALVTAATGAAGLRVLLRAAGLGTGAAVAGSGESDGAARELLEAAIGAAGCAAPEQVASLLGADGELRILYGALVPAAVPAAGAAAGWQAVDGIDAPQRALVDLALAHWRRRARLEPGLAAPLLPPDFAEAEFTAALGMLRAEALPPWEALEVFDRLLAAGILRRSAAAGGERRYHLFLPGGPEPRGDAPA